VLELAAHYHRGPLPARQIAQQGGLPEPFVKKLLQQLTAARLVRALRGRRGGYALARSPQDISLHEILKAFEDLAPVSCLRRPPESSAREPDASLCAADVQEEACPARVAWAWIDRHVRATLQSITLADLLREVRAQGFSLGEDHG
jgi:Rrf2 family protein